MDWAMGSRTPKPTFNYDPTKGPRWPNHMENFLQCVRTGEYPRYDVDQAFIETATLLMSVKAYKQKRQVRWDPTT